MKEKDVQKLVHGLYRIYWKDGGTSLAAVGSLHSGTRWLAPTNWTCKDDGNPTGSGRKTWKSVKSVALIETGK